MPSKSVDWRRCAIACVMRYLPCVSHLFAQTNVLWRQSINVGMKSMQVGFQPMRHTPWKLVSSQSIVTNFVLKIVVIDFDWILKCCSNLVDWLSSWNMCTNRQCGNNTINWIIRSRTTDDNRQNLTE